MEDSNEVLKRKSCFKIARTNPKSFLNSINNKDSTTDNRYEQNDQIHINKLISRSEISVGENNNYILWILTPLVASFSVVMIIAALAGPVWLITEERLVGTNFKMNKEGSTMAKCTKSSLWIICSAVINNSTNCTIQSIQDVESYSCMKIDYFPREEYRADAHDSTSAIPYTIIKSCPFFLTSGIMLIVSFIVFLIPTVFYQNILYYFTAGILFIVSGLLMLIGLIVYISIFKSEIGSKLRSKSAFEPPIFRFAYGQSFFLYVFGFIFTEFVGLLNIFLYISLLELRSNKKKIPCLPFIAFHPKSKHSFKTCQKLDPQLICKKHSIPINLLFDSDTGKRYYFEKLKRIEDDSRNLAKSLNQLYTEPAPTFSSFDLSYRKESPLTRSVSTTTDIFSENKKVDSAKVSGFGRNDICGFSSEISRGIRKTKDDLVNEFFKRTGVKPKPKNIYFIDNHGENLDDNFTMLNDYSKVKNNHCSHKVLSRVNSNNSLKNQYEKFQTKSVMNLRPNVINKYNDFCFLNDRYYNDTLHQSQTLPRSFMKKYLENQNYNYSIEDSSNSHTKNSYNLSNNQLCKSCGDVNFVNEKQKFANNSLNIQWPQAIPVSPSYSMKSSNFYSRIQPGDYKQQRTSIPYFNSDYEISNLITNESFDLDQIEKDCRVSHANLFKEGNYDTIDGTPV